MRDLSGTQAGLSKHRYLAIWVSLAVTIIWSSTFVIVKIGLETLGPLTIAGLRYLIGALVLLPFMLLQKSQRKPITRNLWLRLILIGISSYTIANGALFWGLQFIPATTGSFLLSMMPLFVLVGGAVFLKELPTRWQLFGVVLSLLGSGLFFSSGLDVGETRGMWIVVIGLFGFMSFILIGRGVAREKILDTLTLTTLPLFIGGAVTIILALFLEGIPQFTRIGLLVVLWLAVINTALGYLLYNHALRELTALEMNTIMNLSPLMTALLSWLILGDKLESIQLIGMIVVIVGVIFVQRAKHPNHLKV